MMNGAASTRCDFLFELSINPCLNSLPHIKLALKPEGKGYPEGRDSPARIKT
jgi:hypothetical protein